MDRDAGARTAADLRRGDGPVIGLPARQMAAAGEALGEITIAQRFNGPPESSNGGYACGRLAEFVGPVAEVTLRLPPPLEKTLFVQADGFGGARLLDGESLVAEAIPVEPFELNPPATPTFEQAVEASAAHPGRGIRHVLSDCFVCSPYRAKPGDGLGVSPGSLSADPTVGSAPFHPDDSVSDNGWVKPEVVWAALDCPSYAPSVMATRRIALLGRLRAMRQREIRAGERLAAVGWTRSSEGRKHRTASALVGEDGSVAAVAEATWIELRS